MRGSAPATSSDPNAGAGARQVQAQTAAQNRGTLLTDPKDIFQHELGLVEGAREKYEALSPELRQRITNFAESQVVSGTKLAVAPAGGGQGGGAVGSAMAGGFGQAIGGNGTPPSAEELERHQAIMAGSFTRNGLLRLMADDKLFARGSEGQTMWSQIERLQSAELGQGLDRQQLVSGLITDTAFGTRQERSLASSELQRVYASQEPADYAKTIADLATSGEARVKGSTLSRGSQTLPPRVLRPAQAGATADLFQNSVSDRQARRELFNLEVLSEPEARTAFSRLSTAEKSQFRGLHENTLGEREIPRFPDMQGKDFGTAPTPEEEAATTRYFEESAALREQVATRQDLQSLLVSGKLSNKDSQGNSLMSNLHGIKEQAIAREGDASLQGDTVLAEVISQVADPGRIRQNNKGTCTVTTIEHLLASRQPAEYARVIGGLTSGSGEVTLQDGTRIRRDAKLVAADDSDRTNSSRIFQATMMEYGNGAGRDYRNDVDGHVNRLSGQFEKNRRGDVRSGLNIEGRKKVSDSVLGSESTIKEFSGNTRRTEDDIAGALRENRAVQVSLKWSRDDQDIHGNHALSVTGMDDKYVYLRNPHGAGDTGNADPGRSIVREAVRGPEQTQGPLGFGVRDDRPVVSPELSSGEAGSIRIEKGVFYENLNRYIVEEEQSGSILDVVRAWFD